MRRWRPTDVFRREDAQLFKRFWLKEGEVYKTVGYTDMPTITVVNVRTGKRANYVIESPLFAEFELLEPRGPA